VLLVDRVGWTSAPDAAPAYRDGRTVLGRIEGEDLPAAVRLVAEANARAERLPEGARLALEAVCTGWDTLHERAVFEGTTVASAA